MSEVGLTIRNCNGLMKLSERINLCDLREKLVANSYKIKRTEYRIGLISVECSYGTVIFFKNAIMMCNFKTLAAVRPCAESFFEELKALDKKNDQFKFSRLHIVSFKIVNIVAAIPAFLSIDQTLYVHGKYKCDETRNTYSKNRQSKPGFVLPVEEITGQTFPTSQLVILFESGDLLMIGFDNERDMCVFAKSLRVTISKDFAHWQRIKLLKRNAEQLESKTQEPVEVKLKKRKFKILPQRAVLQGSERSSVYSQTKK